jgi:hypothetical protein
MEVLGKQYISRFFSALVVLGCLDPTSKPEILRSSYHICSAKLVFKQKASPLIKKTFKRRV